MAKKLSPEQTYLLYTYVNKNKDTLKNLTWVDAGREVRRGLQFYVANYTIKRAMLYFGLQKEKNPVEYFADTTICKMDILIKHIAILYKEQVLPIPEEIRKML